MKTPAPPVKGIRAPGVRLTPFGTALLALGLALPGGLLIGLIGWLI